MVPPRFELGSWEPESHMLPLHHGTLVYIIPTPRWYSPAFIFFPYSHTHQSSDYTYIHTHIHTHTPSYPHTYPTFLSVISVRLIFLLCPLFFFHPFPTYYKKTPPVGLEPTTLRLKAARSTDWARKALAICDCSLFTILLTFWLLYPFPSFISYDNVAEWSKACD